MDTITWGLDVWIGGLEEMVVGVEAMTNRDTMVIPLDKVGRCLRWKYFDKGVRLWQVFDLGRSQDMKLSHGGLQPWVNRGSVIAIRWKFASLKPVVDTG